MSPLRSSVSECQFYPSCSHYSSEAIKEYGFSRGLLLTADRFIRCSGGTLSRNDYPYQNQKLIDKPSSNNIWGDKNLWKLTFNKSNNQGKYQNQSLDNSTPKNSISTNYIFDFEFSKSLFIDRNFDNSIYELRKINFYADDNLTKNKANLLMALNFLKMNKYSDARTIIDNTNKLIENTELIQKIDNLILEYIINDLDNANSWNINKFTQIKSIIKNDIESETFVKNDTLQNFQLLSNKFLAYSYLKTNEFENSINAINSNFQIDSELNPNVIEKEKIQNFLSNAKSISGYSPEIAAVLSTILPGSGYVYAGHYKEGLSALIINALLGAGIYSQVRSKNLGTAIFTSMVTLPFYLGNIVGSYNTAENENLKTKQIILNDYRHLLGINIYFSDIYFISLFEK